MRMQPHVDHDNTALNAVRLICAGGDEVISSEGEYGEWTEVLRYKGVHRGRKHSMMQLHIL